jgi:hypothetical protein
VSSSQRCALKISKRTCARIAGEDPKAEIITGAPRPNPLLVRSRGDGRRFDVRTDEKLTAFVELEREVLTVTLDLESIHANDGN